MAMSTPTINVLGSLNIDLVYYIPHHPLPGETLTANNFNVSPGGKGANQAVACAKLSRTRTMQDVNAKVVMTGAVGADTHGTILLSSLGSYGVDTSEVVSNKGNTEWSTTGSAVVMVEEQTGQNRIILSPGANGSLQPNRFTRFPGPRPALLVMQLEIPLETVLQALRTAKDARTPVLLNPAPALQLPEEAYDGLEHLILNETELALLAGISEDLEDLSVVEKAAAEFQARGVKNMVVTLGGKGAYYTSEHGESSFVPALKVDVVDTTAAGDTFIGMYAVLAAEAFERSEKFDIGAAVRRSIIAASVTVSRKGAQISIPWRDELDSW